MKKPLVLKRQLRLETREVIVYVLFVGFLIWWTPRDLFAATINLIIFSLITAHRFLRRVTLSDHKISIWRLIT